MSQVCGGSTSAIRAPDDGGFHYPTDYRQGLLPAWVQERWPLLLEHWDANSGPCIALTTPG